MNEYWFKVKGVYTGGMWMNIDLRLKVFTLGNMNEYWFKVKGVYTGGIWMNIDIKVKGAYRENVNEYWFLRLKVMFTPGNVNDYWFLRLKVMFTLGKCEWILILRLKVMLNSCLDDKYTTVMLSRQCYLLAQLNTPHQWPFSNSLVYRSTELTNIILVWPVSLTNTNDVLDFS